MELFDTHSHLTFPELEQDVDGVIARSMEAGVTRWITVGTDSENNRNAVNIIRGRDNLYAAVGIHPHHAKEVTEEDLDILRDCAVSDKVVAMGEMGLDFHYNFSKKDAQKSIFHKQLQLAVELSKPVIIHCRNAFEETTEILKDYMPDLKNVVIHCFSSGPGQAEVFLEMGCYISFTGIVTFKNAEEARQSVAVTPLERLMLETDCPYISPAPKRNQRPCEPALLIHTAQKIADIKSMNLEEIARLTNRTSMDFFGVD